MAIIDIQAELDSAEAKGYQGFGRSVADSRHTPIRAILTEPPPRPAISWPRLCAASGAHPRRRVISVGSRLSPVIRDVATERCTCAIGSAPRDAADYATIEA